MTRGHGHTGEPCPQGVRARFFVERIGIAVQKSDGDRCDALAHASGDDGVQIGKVERRDDVAPRIHALAHFQTQAARHERRGRGRVKVVEVRTVAAPDLEDIAESRGGHERRFHALAFGDGVDDGGAAVNQAVDPIRTDVPLFLSDRDRVQDTSRRIVGCRQCLGDRDPAAFGVVVDEVGECAADIGGEVAHGIPDSFGHISDSGARRLTWRGRCQAVLSLGTGNVDVAVGDVFAYPRRRTLFGRAPTAAAARHEPHAITRM